MQLHTSEEWIVNAPLPRWDDMREFWVWSGKDVRSVRRVGNLDPTRLTPGTVIFTDCTHPIQNVLCDESQIQGWRIKAQLPKKKFH